VIYLFKKQAVFSLNLGAFCLLLHLLLLGIKCVIAVLGLVEIGGWPHQSYILAVLLKHPVFLYFL
jgi:hypothetical protein